jgi:hypothetical protein
MKKINFFLLFLFSWLNLYGQEQVTPISETQAYNFVNSHVSSLNDDFQNLKLKDKIPYSYLKDNRLLAYIFEFEPQGFVIVSPNNNTNPIMAFSTESDFDFQSLYSDNTVSSIIDGIYQNHCKIQNSLQTDYNISDKTNFVIGPFVQSIYGQVNCVDNGNKHINTTNYYTPNHYAAGCVAISMLTMMQYYEWPDKGIGIHQNHDIYGNSTGIYISNFEESAYDWANILTEYYEKPSTEIEQQAIGEIAFHIANALDMNFESTGSSASTSDIPNAGKEFFSYISNYMSSNASSFWATMDTNMFHHIPVTLAIQSSNGAGHSCVVDGIRITDDSTLFYHLNLGWWGSSNGWYNIRGAWNAGGYNSIYGGVFDFLPKPYMKKPKKISGTKLYTLEWKISDNIKVEEYELRRKINTGLWHKIPVNGLEDTLRVEVGEYDDYYFEVRAKIDGRWFNNGWSNRVIAEDNSSATPEIDHQEFTIYPNPNSGNFNLEIPNEYSSEKLKLEVYNCTGKNILSQTMIPKASSISFSLGDVYNGIYLMKIGVGNKFYIMRFLKDEDY